MSQKKPETPKTPKNLIVLAGRKKQGGAEETPLDQDISVDEFNFHRTVEAVAALLTTGDVLIENVAVLLQKAGSNEEKEAWQIFEKKWEEIADLFAIFWETP